MRTKLGAYVLCTKSVGAVLSLGLHACDAGRASRMSNIITRFVAQRSSTTKILATVVRTESFLVCDTFPIPLAIELVP